MIHLGSIGGTSIDIDPTFLLLIAFFVFNNYNPAFGIQYALLWIPIVFVSVLIHELSHAATIAAFGYGSSQIVLGGMGGVTVNSRRAKSWHDMIISLMGPIASFALALACVGLQLRWSFAKQDPMFQVLLPLLIEANFFWCIFNLLPIPPLDGGHAVRSFFSTFLRDRLSFVITVWMAMVVGVGVVIVCFVHRQFFIALLLGVYVFRNFQQWQYFQKYNHPGD